MDERTKKLVRFQEWVERQVDSDASTQFELVCDLCDALWKGSLDDTQLYRRFELEQRGLTNATA